MYCHNMRLTMPVRLYKQVTFLLPVVNLMSLAMLSKCRRQPLDCLLRVDNVLQCRAVLHFELCDSTDRI